MRFVIGVVVVLCVIQFLLPSRGFARKMQTQKDEGQKVYQSEVGLKIPKLGIAIDAIYEPRLDRLIPGYKVLNVIIANSSAADLVLDPKKDKWTVINSRGDKVKTLNHLALKDEGLWMKLPVGLRESLHYPSQIKPGSEAKLDLLVQWSEDLTNFREIQWKSNSLKKDIYVLAQQQDFEKEPEAPPLPATPAREQSREKYEAPEGPSSSPTETIRPEPQFDPQLDDFTIETH